MSNKAKGIWGNNPSLRNQYQPSPRHIKKPEVSDGCAGIALILVISIVFFIVF